MNIKIDLRPNGGGVAFWDHTFYRVRINDKQVSDSASALDTLEIIEGAMREAAYPKSFVDSAP
jgi:hypothetical protein